MCSQYYFQRDSTQIALQSSEKNANGLNFCAVRSKFPPCYPNQYEPERPVPD
jgi:hypothetical protein